MANSLQDPGSAPGAQPPLGDGLWHKLLRNTGPSAERYDILELMHVSVNLPDDLSRQLERVCRREQRSVDGLVREAIEAYVKQRQRRVAGEALMEAAAENPLNSEQVRAALEQLHRDRDHSDRP